jgi:uncharacterized caspase-like protein
LANCRVALVIGMADYEKVVKLDNTLVDSRGTSNTFSGIGFNVTNLLDSDAEELSAAVDEFGFRVATVDLALIHSMGTI